MKIYNVIITKQERFKTAFLFKTWNEAYKCAEYQQKKGYETNIIINVNFNKWEI